MHEAEAGDKDKRRKDGQPMAAKGRDMTRAVKKTAGSGRDPIFETPTS